MRKRNSSNVVAERKGILDGRHAFLITSGEHKGQVVLTERKDLGEVRGSDIMYPIWMFERMKNGF